ncbi:MAG: endonuclease/exonuclease/phosphatase family protein [Actinobacteria bacterium]|nr:endonuclease/exonuclease/phosphatase family protein [Actinomycetota bacterium]MBA3739120.1 endonuclease/exonuclease/phosphatase family protein [Actinomycetota bacterium]
MELTIATFNIHHGEGSDGRLDLERTAAAILATGAEMIALQELDRNFRRSDHLDQPAILAELTGLRVHFRPTVRRGGGEYGIALAATDDLEVDLRTLPREGDEEERGAILTSWRGIGVVGVHLATQRAARRLQLPALVELASPSNGPVVVLGDLNASHRELRPLGRDGLDTGPGRAPTVRSRLGSRRIDHVLAGGGARVLRTWTVPGDASDHVPLVAHVAI